ncbi:MAG TPA: hypothetical protein DCY94_00045 [Firmicutes bacterium]|nr:hypothetical protein [Bacillota bacterium]
MKRSIKTKKALMLSLFSIILSIIMLAGSTFAWFTDTATSGKNKIVAGNLDVELYHSNGKAERAKITDTTELFDVDIWEPGVVAYENFEVLNAGELALKYKFTMAIGDFNTVAETTKSLKDVLKVSIIEDGSFNGSREDIASLPFDKTLADFEKEGILNIKNDSDKFAIVIYWQPTDTDDDYNLNNGKTSSDSLPLYIDLGINLVATQNAFEADSFGSDYDDTTEYKEVSTAQDFLNNIYYANSEQGVRLTSDIAVPWSIPQSTKGLSVIDLNGHTLSTSVATTTLIEQNNSMVIKNGNLVLQSSNISGATLSVESGGSLTLENVEFTTEQGAGIYPRGDAAKVNIVNSTIDTKGLAISTNAGSTENYNVQINVINSTISSKQTGAASAILVNIPCKLNIESSNINGYLHGVIVRGGTAVIKNSTITNKTSKDENELEHYFDSRDWGQGNAVNLGALVIGNKHSTNYQYPSDVTLINTKIVAATLDDEAITFPTVYMYGNTGEGLGATLTYDSKSTVGDIVRGNEHVTVNAIE